MARLYITPENQIQRLNIIMNDVQALRTLSLQSLTLSFNPKSWSVLEVIEHLNIAYSFYHDKVDNALRISPNIDSDSKAFKLRTWQQFVINGQKPKNGKRKWKMKTLKKFNPVFPSEELNDQKVNEVFSRFEQSYGHLRQAILRSRRKDVSKSKVSSAIGPIVTFYLPECFEFLICHAERHMIQIQKILKEQDEIGI